MLYTNDGTRLTDAEKAAFYTKWEADGKDKPRIRSTGHGDIILTAAEIAEIEKEWVANAPDWVAMKIAEAGELADRKVVQIVSKENQMIYGIRALELNEKRDLSGTLTVEENKELTAIKALNNRARAVRDAEKLVIADIRAAANAETFDGAGSVRWP